MSEQTTEPEAVEIPRHGDDAFGALMDVLAPEGKDQDGAAEKDAAGPGAGDGEAGAAGAAGELGAGEGAAPTGTDPATKAAGDAGDEPGGADEADSGTPDVPADGAAGADGERPAAWTASAEEYSGRLGILSTTFEENVSRSYHEAALEEVREEHGAYFEVLEKHPYTLVGAEVPRLGEGAEGMQRLQSSEEAREWQEAAKSLLVAEVKDRAQSAIDDNGDFLAAAHASIELFQNNKDLIPGTKEFDVQLANRFTEFAEPYELRTEDGKLYGYSIPVQHLIDKIRVQLGTERKASSTPPAAPAKVEPAGAGSTGASAGASTPTSSSPPSGDQPQAGVQSKAGNSSTKENFEALWGTLGLPDIPL